MGTRFVQFVKNLDSCKKLSIRILANLRKNDFNTVYKFTFHVIARDCNTNVNNFDKIVKQNVKFCETSAENEWKIPLLKELFDIRSMYYLLNEFEDQEINYRHDTFYAPISLISINCAFNVISNFISNFLILL